MPPPRRPRLPGVVFLLALLASLAAPSEARAELCDREGYIRHGADCPNAERDFTGCCPGPALQARARAERAAAARARASEVRARAEAARAREEAERDRARVQAEATRAREEATRAREEAERERARVQAERERVAAAHAAATCPEGTARPGPGHPCCHPALSTGGASCICPAGWALREHEAHPNAPHSCLPEGRYEGGMTLFDQHGRPRASLDERPGILLDREPLTRQDHSVCMRRGVCPRRDREEVRGAILLSRAEAAIYCAFVGKRLPTEREWALLSPSVEPETPTWTQASPSRAAERRAVRCAAEPEPLRDDSLRERLGGLSNEPSALAVRLHAAARQAHAEADPVTTAVNYRALAQQLPGDLGALASRWAAEAHFEAGDLELARDAYARYLLARDELDDDARTNSVARELGFGERRRRAEAGSSALGDGSRPRPNRLGAGIRSAGFGSP